MMEKVILFWLMQIPGIGSVTIRRLYERFGSFEALFNIEERQLFEEKLLSETECERLKKAKEYFKRQEERYHTLLERGIQFITEQEEKYPKRLKPLWDRPAALFVKGSLPSDEKPSAAIVGSRNCSYYGSEMAEYFGRKLAERGIQIISGLALGVDSAGHRGAIQANGFTYGVLGCGITTCYPTENFMLYEEISEKGGILSEYAPGVKPCAGNFPARNRIISGLSDVVLVMEAKEKSGALITADFAMEQGKEIFALPGRITERLSKGCNELIRNGAGILVSEEDILDFFSLKYEKKINVYEKRINGLANPQKMLYSFLDSEPKYLEEIVKGTGMTVSDCLSGLMELELQGYIIQTANLYYIKKS